MSLERYSSYYKQSFHYIFLKNRINQFQTQVRFMLDKESLQLILEVST